MKSFITADEARYQLQLVQESRKTEMRNATEGFIKEVVEPRILSAINHEMSCACIVIDEIKGLASVELLESLLSENGYSVSSTPGEICIYF